VPDEAHAKRRTMALENVTLDRASLFRRNVRFIGERGANPVVQLKSNITSAY